MQASTTTRNYRWEVAARAAIAFFGGFWWVSSMGALTALVLRLGGMPLEQGVHIMTLAGFVIWCALAMWAFYTPRLSRAVVRIFGTAFLLTIGVLLLK